MNKDRYIKDLEKQNEKLLAKCAKLEEDHDKDVEEASQRKPRIGYIRDATFGSKRGKCVDEMFYMADVVIERMGNDTQGHPIYEVTKNRFGRNGVTISGKMAKDIFSTGDISCLE